MELEIIHNSELIYDNDVKLTHDINHNEISKENTYCIIVNNKFVNKIHINTFEVKAFASVVSLNKNLLIGNLAFIRLRKTGAKQTMINCNRLNHTKLVVRYGCTR